MQTSALRDGFKIKRNGKKKNHYLLLINGIQGGSDKSGILKILVENLTAQLKIIQFYKTKKQLTEGHIENQDIQ
jgi:hypothetical protein